MVEKSRLELLEEFLQENPNDSFARYAIGLEHLNLGQYQQAIEAFEKLVELDPDYTATYYQLGRACEAAGRTEQAERAYRRGIEACRRAGDFKTKVELEEALRQLSGEEL